MYDSPFATMYYPWVKVENPIGDGANREIMVPPSGHVAGLWARTDATRGVWKAPANDTLRGVLDIERVISQTEQSLLNPIGINCIRPFGVRGIRVWARGRSPATPTGPTSTSAGCSTWWRRPSRTEPASPSSSRTTSPSGRA